MATGVEKRSSLHPHCFGFDDIRQQSSNLARSERVSIVQSRFLEHGKAVTVKLSSSNQLRDKVACRAVVRSETNLEIERVEEEPIVLHVSKTHSV